jgi:very-short-patch-repair endonuclease
MSIVEDELKAARGRLLDLTLRNRLLNYRPAKARAIRVVDELPGQVFDFLVLQEKTMKFRPKVEGVSVHEEDDAGEEDFFRNEQEDWELPPSGNRVDERYTGRFLQTVIEADTLQKRLFYVDHEAKSVLEEQGYNVLYLALGFLYWNERERLEEVRRAPLVLIPVELFRSKAGTTYGIKWTGEDVQSNISLEAKLREQNVTLPEFNSIEDNGGLERYFKELPLAFVDHQDWQLREEIYLDFFSFNKFVMYRDLDPQSWPENANPADHPLLSKVIAPTCDERNDNDFRSEDIDRILTPENTFHIYDADPSQVVVIQKAKAGQNLVVEGPPGTGKSQTIVNLIGELLALGKGVLFVSEKMAALEVVKDRLDKVGLGSFCLELHSRKANRRQILSELGRAVQEARIDGKASSEGWNELCSLQSELNGYPTALRDPFSKLGRSPFKLFEMKEEALRYFEKAGHSMPYASLPGARECGEKEYAEAIMALKRIQDEIAFIGTLADNPWYGCNLKVILPSGELEIAEQTQKCLNLLSQLEEAIKKLVDCAGIEYPTSSSAVQGALAASKIIGSAYPTDRFVLLSNGWDQPNPKAEGYIALLENTQGHRKTSLEHFNSGSIEQKTDELADELRLLGGRFSRFFKGRYYALRREIRALYRDKWPKADTELIEHLDHLAEYRQLKEQVKQVELEASALFGSHWQGEEGNTEELRAFSGWIVDFRRQLLEKRFSEVAVEKICNGINPDEVARASRMVCEISLQFDERIKALCDRLNVDLGARFGFELMNSPYADFAHCLCGWQDHLTALLPWTRYVVARDECEKTVAAPLLALIEKDKLYSGDILPCFDGCMADELLRAAFAERPALAQFVGEAHERRIDRFRKMDRHFIRENRSRLWGLINKNRPSLNGGASRQSSAGILIGEMQRRRGGRTIRKLMKDAGDLIQKLKPCFMMSPLSIAQYLDPRSVQFDVLIFDEASQVKPEDALGALLRGRQVVVMGDTRQLPPTSFFDRMIADDPMEVFNDAEDGVPEPISVTEMESILHQCKRSFPVSELNWHYRSKHESLIAVANQEFYNNNLLIYPSSVAHAPDLGLKWVYHPETIYDRGRSRTNRKEAKLIAQEIMEHYRKRPGKSLGVGTFNIAQQRAIEEEVEILRRQNSNFDELLSALHKEPFFVKNLETIQGDERDVIFISVGYGKDSAGKLSLNFGPLNQEGGWRRLNVLITRSKEQCVIFSNFRSDELPDVGNLARGVRVLKVFLKYAQTGHLADQVKTREDSDSPFEDSVFDALVYHDWEVRRQIGCAGFRVDLGVVDPDAPGRYLVGIECDGAPYHSSLVARERDRLRQQILEENMGWRIYRIWSTDWYRNRNETKLRLLEAVTRIHEESRRLKPAPPVEDDDPQEPSPKDDAPLLLNPIITISKDDNPPYLVCNTLNIYTNGEILDCPIPRLALAVIRIVQEEGPVHLAEVARRIRALWGLKKTGSRIFALVRKAVDLAHAQEQIRMSDKFLWSVEEREILPRRRESDQHPQIDLICDEEIASAIKCVLRRQFATTLEDLIMESSRLLGFLATHGHISNRIKGIIGGMLERKDLQSTPNGRIDLG